MSVELVDRIGDLPTLRICNLAATAEISLRGAHLISLIPAGGQELLWNCPNGNGEADMTLHGGIPICWPWFGKPAAPPELPEHGFARTSAWKLLKTEDLNDRTTCVTLGLEDSPESHRLWDFKFKLEASFTISDTVSVQVITTNTDSRPFTISEGLHTFFRVGDIGQVTILGFDGLKFFNKVAGSDGNTMPAGPFHVDQEVDRVFHDAQGPFSLQDASLKRSVSITPENSRSAVIWNPWQACYKHLPGYVPEDYRSMVCVETCHAMVDARTVLPQESSILKASYTIADL